ncbi:hypothetical protein [Bradyrhizobium sp. S3.9.1]|uniref:hypothetical protein n=1 Tax=Bradyrhizobium sp. S3.9.1 TaxID=3156431 RepID=UPI003393323E
MQAQEAARIFHDWASIEGMLPEGPVTSVQITNAEKALISPVTDLGKQVLRTKQILSVGFNEAASEIVVFTKRAAPTTKRHKASLPQKIENVSIVYRQGVQNPVGPDSLPFSGPTYAVRNVGGQKFYTCGSSISVGNNREAGTLGAIVRDSSAKQYGLTNNHVSGSCSFAPVGLPILAPGIVDVVPGNLSPFTIGFHSVALKMAPGSADNVIPSENLDGAIFELSSHARVSSFQGSVYDTPAQAGALTANMNVEKVGRTTGHTHGRVLGQMHGPHPIQYSAAIYGFSGIVRFDPVFAIVGNGQLFSDSGDSGSLITAIDGNGDRIGVGIVVGGMNDGSAPGGKITIALPLLPILQGFGVSLVSGYNT